MAFTGPPDRPRTADSAERKLLDHLDHLDQLDR